MWKATGNKRPTLTEGSTGKAGFTLYNQSKLFKGFAHNSPNPIRSFFVYIQAIVRATLLALFMSARQDDDYKTFKLT